MFPYRRGQGKKRSKGGNGRRNGAGNNRALPGAIGDIMPALQPATKAVAQLISGNTRPSGQVTHARNILRQAQRAIDDRVAERLPPQIKESFLEQVALLRLTLADAASLEEAQSSSETEAETDDEVDAVEDADAEMERLRKLALAIAGSTPAEKPAPQVPSEEFDDDHDEDEFRQAALANATAKLRGPAKPAEPTTRPSVRGGALNKTDKLRLKAVLDERRNSDG